MTYRIIAAAVITALSVTPVVAQVSAAEPRETTELRVGDDGACFVDDTSPLAKGGTESSAALGILVGALAKAGTSAAVSFAKTFIQRQVDARVPSPVVVSEGALSVQFEPVVGGGVIASSPLTCISVNHGLRKLDDQEARDPATVERVIALDPFKHFHEGDSIEEFDPVDLDTMDLLLPPEFYAEIWLEWHEAKAFRPILGAVYLREPIEAISSRRTMDLAITVTLTTPDGNNGTAFAFALTELTPGQYYPAGYFTTSSPWIVNPASPSEEDMKAMDIETYVRTGLVNIQVSLQQSQEPGLILSYANQMMTLLDEEKLGEAATTALSELLVSQED